jgi:hypothetical protein
MMEAKSEDETEVGGGDDGGAPQGEGDGDAGGAVAGDGAVGADGAFVGDAGGGLQHQADRTRPIGRAKGDHPQGSTRL